MPSSTTSASMPASSSVHKHQTAPKQIDKSRKCKQAKDVVIHQPAPSPPMEDWVLFPEDVVIDKHSSLRKNRSLSARRNTETKGLSKPLSAPDDKMTKTIVNAQEYIKSRNQNRDVNNSCSHWPIEASSNTARQKIIYKPLRVDSPKRLLTPDLSDIEEDDFWSCCATSESSL